MQQRPAGRILEPRIALFFLIAVVVFLALWLRFSDLSHRPMHTDEAVHAVKLGILYDSGEYLYNPREYHGPVLYHFTWPLLKLSGLRAFADIADETPLRAVPALFGAGLIALLWLLRKDLGPAAALWAALFTAVSPAMVFYSRYYIQETPLVFFTFAAIACGWRYLKTAFLPWGAAAGAAFGFMFAAKETAIIACAAMLGAGILTRLFAPAAAVSAPRPAAPRWHFALFLLAALIVALTCLTNFFANPGAAKDAFYAYLHYFDRAGSGDSSSGSAEAHRHPWHYYLHMLLYFRHGPGPWWSEASILLLACVGLGSAFTRGASAKGPAPAAAAETALPRFLGFYTLLLLLAYSAIPYKTPWCLLSFLHGAILLAGIGAQSLFRRARKHAIAQCALAALLLLSSYHLFAQAQRGNTRFASDPRNPYVYSHTSAKVFDLVRRFEQLAAVHPHGTALRVDIAAPGSDYWPLPWYLRRFPNVGYWESLPEDPQADVIITGPDVDAELDARLQQDRLKEYHGLRPEVLLVAYIKNSLWAAFMEEQQSHGP